MMLDISEPITYCPDRASEENNWTNYSYTYQTGSCSAGDWSYIYERKSSEYNRIEAEAEIAREFEKHKLNCSQKQVEGLMAKAKEKEGMFKWLKRKLLGG